MSLLKARLLDAQRSAQTAANAEARRVQVGSGDRSQRVRTYNFPQGRITDHRINLTIYRLDQVIEGTLDDILIPLTTHFQSEALNKAN